jgi:transposase
MSVLAADISKDRLCAFDGKQAHDILNQGEQIDELLRRYPKDWAVILEPTSIYHMELAERAYRAGHTVYLVNPRVMAKFRQARSFRAKTDPKDAECLHEFGLSFASRLRPWSPLPKELERLRRALKRYHKLTQARVKIVQTMRGYDCPELDRALLELGALADKLQLDAVQAARSVDEDFFERLMECAGFGAYSACALTLCLKSRPFESPDAVRAFIGMDLLVRDSGKKKGRRCLSKCGDSMLRHAATCAGRGLLNSRLGRNVNLELKARNREHPERMVIAARKQIRTAWWILKSGGRFDPEKFTWRVDKKT